MLNINEQQQKESNTQADLDHQGFKLLDRVDAEGRTEPQQTSLS